MTARAFSSSDRAVRAVSFVRSLLVATLTCAACGGSPPAATPDSRARASSEGATTASKSSSAGDDAATPKKKKSSKYPAQFYEPDCNSVATDGYLPDAQKVLAEVRKKNWDRLKSCVDGLDDVHGDVNTSFRLDPDGTAHCVDAPGSSMDNEDVVLCVIAMYRTFHYPSPKGGSVRVSDGLRFDVSEDDE